ncbi:MAG: EAL domain-containing protein [Planctomycetes bacterium]|nr:EAL domain-containing protein [Planctomycetota bacterium]
MTSHPPASLLVVDDQEMNRDLLGRRLERNGYTVALAEDGQQALDRIAQGSFDLVLLDIMMPGIDGFEVLRRIRESHSPIRLPVIMVTARDESEDVVKALQGGANDYVTKPVDLLVALARIETHLALKRGEMALRLSEERYALALAGANDGIWDWDLKTNQIYFSARWKSLLGCQENEVAAVPDEWFQRVHPRDIDRLKSDLSSHLSGVSPHFQNEHRMLHTDGDYRWILSRGLGIRDDQGKVYRMAGSLTDITERRVTDPLTGLPNRILFLDRLQRAVDRMHRHPSFSFAVLSLDVDGFKKINESMGHQAGDHSLVEIGRRLQAGVRTEDTVSRFGGNEFIILLDGCKDLKDLNHVVERLRGQISFPLNLEGQEIFLTASIGVAWAGPEYQRPEDLIRDAHTAMNRAKKAGPGRCEVFDPAMHARSLQLLKLETDLRRGVERREFRVYYQPIVSLQTGRISGFEALIRWKHPAQGIISPGEFIPLAEETGLILPLGLWILREACSQTVRWQSQQPRDPNLMISVNLSPRQFSQPELVGEVQNILAETGLPAPFLKLEITETALMEQADTAADLLSRLKQHHIRIGLDDFGTGYSSLSYLHRYPLDTLKIDRSFVRRIGMKGENLSIIRSIARLAQDLNLMIIAEGIETAEQLAELRGLTCDYGQGYLFSPPVESVAAEKLLIEDPHW